MQKMYLEALLSLPAKRNFSHSEAMAFGTMFTNVIMVMLLSKYIDPAGYI